MVPALAQSGQIRLDFNWNEACVFFAPIRLFHVLAQSPQLPRGFCVKAHSRAKLVSGRKVRVLVVLTVYFTHRHRGYEWAHFCRLQHATVERSSTARGLTGANLARPPRMWFWLSNHPYGQLRSTSLYLAFGRFKSASSEISSTIRQGFTESITHNKIPCTWLEFTCWW